MFCSIRSDKRNLIKTYSYDDILVYDVKSAFKFYTINVDYIENSQAFIRDGLIY